MRHKTCFDAFSAGQLARKKHPLPYGEYKLRECHDRLSSTTGELARIQALVSGRGDKWPLMHCTNEDKHVWIKGVPNDVAWRLGYEVLPGLKALAGDGVTSAQIDLTYPVIEQGIQQLLPQMEAVRLLITRCINNEYQQMRLGTPLLKPLVNKATALTRRALQAHSIGPRGPVFNSFISA